MARVPIPKHLRFEVFKRDSFTCQYCGRKAPDAVLHVDHIDPVSKGGDNGIINLITSCVDCNLGKSDRKLSDRASIEKQQAQIEMLNERREQLEMMVEWATSLRDVDNQIAEKVAAVWEELIQNKYSVNDVGMSELRGILRKYGPDQVVSAMHIAFDRYVVKDTLSLESVNLAWSKIGGILYVSNQSQSQKNFYYIRGILRRRLAYLNERAMWTLLNDATRAGAPGEDLLYLAKSSDNWSQWRNSMEELISELSEDGDAENPNN